MRSKQIRIAAVSLIFLGLTLVTPAHAETSRLEQIQNAQAEIERLDQQISYNQMLSFNLMRNLEDNDRRQQERRVQAEVESDARGRQLILDTINGWDIWASEARTELFGYNEIVRNAQNRVLYLQDQIARLQAAEAQDVNQATDKIKSDLNNSAANSESPSITKSALEQENIILQGQISLEQNKTQQQIFSLNAVNTAIQALKTGSETWYALMNTKKIIENALDQTSMNLRRNQELLELQTKILEELKDLSSTVLDSNQSSVKKTLENVSDLDSQLTTKIEVNRKQILDLDKNVVELESALKNLNEQDPTYAQVQASRDFLKDTRENLVDSSSVLTKLQIEQDKISEQARKSTLVMRTVAVITGDLNSYKIKDFSSSLAFQRTKSGLLTSRVSLIPEGNRVFAVTPQELRGVSITVRGPKGTYRVRVKNSGDKALIFTLPKRISSGKYELNIKLAGKNMVSFPANISIK